MAALTKILLVEDNLQLTEIYSHFLRHHGFDVAVAADGDEALEKATAYRPDLVFIDIMMPKKDGYEVLKLLRHSPEYNCTKARLVILTNIGDSSKVSNDVREAMDGYIVKAEIVLRDLLSIIASFEQRPTR